uniref:Uncharacterized protein n=1 Tax=Panagrolaimus sp. PS1159 TaxID=55785 RepID=A0AC35FI75_9BILA
MLNIYDCTIKHSDGTIVTADKLLENLQQLGIFLLSCTENSIMFQSDTATKIVQHFNKIQRLFCFTLTGLTENFNFSSFKDYFLKNETVSITLEFNNVSAVYKEMVENIIKETKKNPALKTPVTKFN